MLTILGRPQGRSGYCDGLARRDFLKIGGMVMGGLALPQLLAAEAQAGIGKSHKAIINVFLPGRPAASGHVGYQARRAGRDPRRIPADQDERARHRDRRVVPAARRNDGQVRRHSLDGRARPAATTPISA